MSAAATAMGYVGALLLGAGGVLGLGLWLGDPGSQPRRLWARYERALDAHARFLFLPLSGARIARLHLALLVAFVGMAWFSGARFLLFFVPVVAVVPSFWLHRRREDKVEKIELQMDTWLTVLSNALKASPSLGDALASSVRLASPPLREELDLTLKEMHLGTPLDAALLGLGERIRSRVVDGTLAGLLVARKTGGDLPKLLDRTASTLREMQRLEGVVRSKTAEGKSQAYVLAVVPFALVGVLHKMDPEFLRPLVQYGTGWVMMAAALVLWASSILAARKILAVDI